ncbi:methyltransferase domain-containing protein [Ferrimonas senticii]|uniref:methyltransferase domain-containing protein n=1 Tax=Ferrimonas senticii TaxID=394566 RepID=UPI00041419A7|nr:methyltransferase domain-containing protein [Ferrimonas senticii]
MNDISFDGRAAKFANNIYGTSKGQVREAVLWHLLQQGLLPQLPLAGRVLDAGGGQGQLARRVAAAGHQVVLTDLSQEMLMLAQEQAEHAGLAARFQYIHGPIQALAEQQLAPFDAVICHAVLEWLADPEPVIAELYQQLKPGGRLSLAFFNYQGAELHNLVAGNFDNLGEAMTTKKTRRVRMVPQHPLHNDRVIAMAEAVGFTVVEQAGVRVIHDYLRDKSLQRTQLERLIELELEFCRKPLYRDIGRYTHLLLQK